MMIWVFLVLMLGLSAWLFAREVMVLGAARREGQDEPRAFNRFRRRTLGLILLILLYSAAAFYENFAAWGHFGLREGFLYAGAFIVLLFWLLITASRDFKETAYAALHERQRMTLESLAQIEEEIQRKREQHLSEMNSTAKEDAPPAPRAKRKRGK